MLVLLDNMQAPTGITQLVGRIMRQPHASRVDRGPQARPAQRVLRPSVRTSMSARPSNRCARGLENGRSHRTLARCPLRLRAGSDRDRRTATAFRQREHLSPPRHAPRPVSRRRLVGTRLPAPHPARRQLGLRSHVTGLAAWLRPEGQLTEGDRSIWAVPHPSSMKIRPSPSTNRFKIGWYARRLGDIVPNPWQGRPASPKKRSTPT